MTTASGGANVLAQPNTHSFVGKRTGSFTSQQMAIASVPGLGWQASANTAGGYAPTNANVTASDSAAHAFQFALNGASSNFNVDGTNNTVNPGTDGWSGGGQATTIGTDGFSNFMTGNLTEVGRWGFAFSGTNNTNMCHNQFVYWGTSTSC